MMSNSLPIEVKCIRRPGQNLYIRATLLYSLPQYTHVLVERCSVHAEKRDINNHNIPQDQIKHVLRCANAGSEYLGDLSNSEHLSVRTLLSLPQAGMDSIRLNYSFMCKNSCPSGMNRRATEIVFTLEDEFGLVLGRRKVSVRVCSCPKRDKEKEEKEFKDIDATELVPRGKKRKLETKKPIKLELTEETDCNDIYELPSVSFEVDV